MLPPDPLPLPSGNPPVDPGPDLPAPGPDTEPTPGPDIVPPPDLVPSEGMPEPDRDVVSH